MTSAIVLTNGELALVDDDDYERLNAHRWQDQKGYAMRAEGRGRSRLVIWMHRELIGAPNGVEVDHINRNTFDNRKANLRLATRQQNMRNRGYARQTEGFKGTYERRGRWYAVITVNGKQVSLGGFANTHEAAVAYDAAARVLFGEFAQLNFPDARDWLLPYGSASVGAAKAQAFLSSVAAQ